MARNELTYRTERIKVSPEPRKVYKPDERPLVLRILSNEEYAQIQQEQAEHFAERDLLLRLLIKSRKLEDQLTTPPPPLIERLASRTPAYEAPAPIPKQVKFRKHKIFKRIEEYKGLVDPTITHLKPFFAKLNERMEGPGTSVEKMAEDKRLEPIWNWYNWLAEIRDIITEEGHEFGVSAWRQLKGACKRIGKVSFENLDTAASFTRYEPTYGFDTNTTKLYPDDIPTDHFVKLGLKDEQDDALESILKHVAGNTAVQVRIYMDDHVKRLNEHYTAQFVNVYQELVKASKQRKQLTDILTKMNARVNELEKASAAHKATLDQIPAGGTSQRVAGGRGMKIPDPSTFSGSDDKMKLDDWLNQIALYCSASGMINDHQKIRRLTVTCKTFQMF
ncbi:hypothetical protein EIP86_004415 [Pleurotus ostreatoroseus]|nr:hypothetical protein EIP86_004415 [Pleurotus ostreatoroseus]